MPTQPARNTRLATEATAGISQAGRVGAGAGFGFDPGARLVALGIGVGSGEAAIGPDAAGRFVRGVGLVVEEGVVAAFASILSMTSFGQSGPESSESISNSTGSGAGVALGTGLAGGWITRATGIGCDEGAGSGFGFDSCF